MKATPFHLALEERRPELADAIYKRLKSSSAPHYSKIGPELLRQNTEKLVDAFLRSARGDAAPFVSYIEKLARERIAEGFFLREIQLALSILEEQAWQLAVETSSITSLVPHLAQITTTVGQAKDGLAQIYLEQKQAAEDRVSSLEQRLEALFKGTEGTELPD